MSKYKFKVGQTFFKIDGPIMISKMRVQKVESHPTLLNTKIVTATYVTRYLYYIDFFKLEKEFFNNNSVLFNVYADDETVENLLNYNVSIDIYYHDFDACFITKNAALKSLIKNNRKAINLYKDDIKNIKDLLEYSTKNDLGSNIYKFIAYKERCVELLNVYIDNLYRY